MASEQTIQIVLVPFTSGGLPLFHEELIYKTVNNDDPDNVVTTYEEASANSSTFGSSNAPTGNAAVSAIVKGASGLSNEYGTLKFSTRPMDKSDYDTLIVDTPGVQTITVASGSDLSSLWDKIKEAGSQINDLNVPYSLFTTNCFSAVGTELAAGGITNPVSEVRSRVGDLYMLGIDHVLPVAAVPKDTVGDNQEIAYTQDASGNQVMVITQESGAYTNVAYIDEKAGLVDVVSLRKQDTNGDGIYDSVVSNSVSSLAPSVINEQIDNNGDGKVDLVTNLDAPVPVDPAIVDPPVTPVTPVDPITPVDPPVTPVDPPPVTPVDPPPVTPVEPPVTPVDPPPVTPDYSGGGDFGFAFASMSASSKLSEKVAESGSSHSMGVDPLIQAMSQTAAQKAVQSSLPSARLQAAPVLLGAGH